MSNMTKQEIFNKVAEALMKQRRPSITLTDLECRYKKKTKTGTIRCAAGHMLPKGEYNPSIEGNDVCGVAYFTKNFDTQLTFLTHLQEAHDLSIGKIFSPIDTEERKEILRDPEQWYQAWLKRMKRIASYHHLDSSILEDNV